MATLSAYVTDEEYEKVRLIAEDRKMTPSKMLRELITNGKVRNESAKLANLRERQRIEQYKLDIADSFKRIRIDLNEVTNNFNQIVEYVNTEKPIDKFVMKKLLEILNECVEMKEIMSHVEQNI